MEHSSQTSTKCTSILDTKWTHCDEINHYGSIKGIETTMWWWWLPYFKIQLRPYRKHSLLQFIFNGFLSMSAFDEDKYYTKIANHSPWQWKTQKLKCSQQNQTFSSSSRTWILFMASLSFLFRTSALAISCCILSSFC